MKKLIANAIDCVPALICGAIAYKRYDASVAYFAVIVVLYLSRITRALEDKYRSGTVSKTEVEDEEI